MFSRTFSYFVVMFTFMSSAAFSNDGVRECRVNNTPLLDADPLKAVLQNMEPVKFIVSPRSKEQYCQNAKDLENFQLLSQYASGLSYNGSLLGETGYARDIKNYSNGQLYKILNPKSVLDQYFKHNYRFHKPSKERQKEKDFIIKNYHNLSANKLDEIFKWLKFQDCILEEKETLHFNHNLNLLCGHREKRRKFPGQLAFGNTAGPLANFIPGTGLCWWHSDFQRSATYLSYATPVGQMSKEEVTQAINDIADRKKIVKLKGYKSLKEFTTKHRDEIVEKLQMQQMSEVPSFGWLKALESTPEEQKAKVLEDGMHKLYDDVHNKKLITYQLLQHPSILSNHARIVVGMDKLLDRNGKHIGYTQRYLDSNSPQALLTRNYRFGQKSLSGWGDFPYTQNEDELKNMLTMIMHECNPKKAKELIIKSINKKISYLLSKQHKRSKDYDHLLTTTEVMRYKSTIKSIKSMPKDKSALEELNGEYLDMTLNDERIRNWKKLMQ